MIQIVFFTSRRYPAYSFGNVAKAESTQKIPDPGAHDPNFNYVKRSQPAFSFGAPYRSLKPMKKPAPNAHCEKKVSEIKKILKLAIILQVVRYIAIRKKYIFLIYKVFLYY